MLRAIFFRPWRDIVREREQAKPLGEVTNRSISGRGLQALTHSFADGEVSVFWSDRQDLAAMAMEIFLGLLALVVLGLALLVAFLYTSWWPLSVLLVLVCVAILVRPFNVWLKWRAEVRTVTNLNFRQDFQGPAWAMWLWNNETHDPLPLNFIISVETKSTILGRILHYGTVKLKTMQQENPDDDTMIHFVRNPADFKEAIEQRIAEAKNLLGQYGPPQTTGVVQASQPYQLKGSNTFFRNPE
jgi:hypothetical protein